MSFVGPDPDACIQILFEIIEVQGDPVIRSYWETGSGGGSGSESVYRFRGLYWGSSWDNGKSGPFDSLPEALEETRAHFITGAVESVDCETQVIGLLNLENFADELVLNLNGKPWKVVTSPGGEQKLMRVKQPRKR